MTGSNVSNKCVICYVADRNYIVPTLVSIKSLRRYDISNLADVVVFTLGLDKQTSERAFLAFEALGAITIESEVTRISGFDTNKYNITHVPHSALGRFFITDMLPSIYENIVYIDGDTWFSKDPSSLLTCNIPHGYIGAAEDPSYFFQNTIGPTGKAVRSYFSNIDIDGRNGYFNSGLLVSSVNTFAELSHRAFEYFVKNTAICRYHDQSALNVVCQDRRIRLSPRYNFATAYCLWGSDSTLDPVMYHFTGGQKPWLGMDEAWPRIRDQYQAEKLEATSVSFLEKGVSSDKVAAANGSTKAYRKKLSSYLLPRAMLYRRNLLKVHKMSILR